jgi:hypothetical protein
LILPEKQEGKTPQRRKVESPGICDLISPEKQAGKTPKRRKVESPDICDGVES